MRSLGADRVANFRAERFEDAIRNADAVLDLVGVEVQERSFQVLCPGGKLISVVSEPDQSLAQRCGVTAMFF